MVMYALREALHCHAEKMSDPLFLHEMINDLLCMNPVNAKK